MLSVTSNTLEKFSEQFRALRGDPTDRLRRRLQLLSDHDRLLVELALAQRLSRRQMAIAMCCSAGGISRKLRRVINRMHDPLITALADSTCTLSPDHRRVAIDYFARRQTIAAIARTHQFSRNEVRDMLHYVRGWHRGISGR